MSSVSKTLAVISLVLLFFVDIFAPALAVSDEIGKIVFIKDKIIDKQGYKLTPSIYEWIDYYYKNPGERLTIINGNKIIIKVKKLQNNETYIKIIYENSKSKRIIRNILLVEKINNTAYNVYINNNKKKYV